MTIFASRTVADIQKDWDNLPEDILEFPYFRTDNAPVNTALVDFRDEWNARDKGEAFDILSGWEWGVANDSLYGFYSDDEAKHALKVVQKMLAVFFTVEYAGHMTKLTVAERHMDSGVRYYPEADGKPFVYIIPDNAGIKTIVSFGSKNEASNLLHRDPDKRTIVYMDARDAREPFKVARVFSMVELDNMPVVP